MVKQYPYRELAPVKPSLNQFTGSDDRLCSTFGCGKQLSLTESLAGSKCVHCSVKKTTIADKNLSWIAKNK